MKVSKINRSVSVVPTFDIEVGGKEGTHSYALPNGLVSHNSTNGIEPPKDLKTTKTGYDLVVPEVESLFADYELMWEMPNNKGFLELAAIMQKFVDQAISTNTRYDPRKFKDNKVPTKLILEDILYGTSLGLKTFYYQITNDDEEKERKKNESEDIGNDDIDDDDAACESCVL